MKTRKSFIALCGLLPFFAACTNASSVAPAIPQDKEIEAKIDKVLSKMTIEEKVGQMTQITLDVLGKGQGDDFVLDETKLAEVIGKYKVGSILNTPGPALSPAKWQEVITRIQEVSMEEIGIPCVYGLDMNHGASYAVGATFFPQNINLGASFNPELAYEAAKICAYETRAINCPWTFCPTVDLSRDPRWSRVWENFGEDCLVNAVIASEMVKGYQGEDANHIGPNNIAVSVKHYLGYGNPRTGKDRTPAYVPEFELLEKNFAPYRACIENGALTIMVNSASVNGVPVHASHKFLTEWLKEGLNWDGMIVTDWADIVNLYKREMVATDKKDAIRIAINAGIDMSMEPYDLDYCDLLVELANEGAVPMSRIDDAVRRVLRLKFRLGLFDTPNTSFENYPEYGGKAFAEVALRAAEESEVLLKNKGILPLRKDAKILLTGPNANSMRCLNGGWSYTWQGDQVDRFAGEYNTIYEAMCNEFGKNNVILEQGVTYQNGWLWFLENEPQIDRAVRAAASADVIVACIGENSYCETPGNLDDLTLSENQRMLVKALAKTGKPLVLVLNEGRPRIIKDIEPLADAVIDILLPGNYGGDALANILSGDVNPSAKLPYTYPKNQASLTLYDYRVSEETDTMEGAYDYNAVVSVQWPFGFGLSYTTFEYSNFQCNVNEFTADTELVFTVDVTNTGSVEGKEVVMLYSRDMLASIVPENRRLRAFEKVSLKPGETKTVTLKISGKNLAFVNQANELVLEKGEFRMQAGKRTLILNCTETSVMSIF